MPIRIITDSTADVSPAAQARLTRVPLTILFGSEEYIDGVTISHHAFYEKLVSESQLPTTSQPTPAAFASAYAAAAKEGDPVVVITISSKLSGTYQSASIAAADFDNVYVVDSLNAAIGTGCLAEYALRLVDQGMDAPQIARELTQAREKIRLFALLDTLEYLKKGGRISGTVAFVGGILSIKPVISVTDGAVDMVAKARGSKQGTTVLREAIVKAGGIDHTMPFLLGYTGNDSTALDAFALQAEDLWDHAPGTKAQICSVIGTHAGPGGIAIAFFAK